MVSSRFLLCSCTQWLEDVEPIKDTSNWLLDNRVIKKTNVTTCLGVAKRIHGVKALNRKVAPQPTTLGSQRSSNISCETRCVDWLRVEECFYNMQKVKSKRDSSIFKFTFIYLFVFDVWESGVWETKMQNKNLLITEEQRLVQTSQTP